MADISVLSLDDNEAFAHIIPRWLRVAPRLHHVAHLPSAAALLEFVALLRPQVVVMDLHMPGSDPMDAMRQVLDQFPGVRFVILTAAPEQAPHALAAGAAAIVDKDDGGEALVAAILKAVDGGTLPGAASPQANSDRNASVESKPSTGTRKVCTCNQCT